MESDGADSTASTGESPLGRWVTLTRGGASIHVFIGSRRRVTKGPQPVLGASLDHLTAHLVNGQVFVHPAGQKPYGHDAHPHYQEARVAAAPQRTEDESARGLLEALEHAPIPSWVRAERVRLLDATRALLTHGTVSLDLRTNGVVPAGRLSALRDQLGRLPPLYRALWHASGMPIEIVGQRHTPLPDLIERERKAGVPGVFEPRLEQVYILPAALGRTAAYAEATVLEEIGHGLDALIGRVVGLEGDAEVPLPSAAIYRSAQTDFRVLYQRYRATSALPAYYRTNRRELFAYGFFSYYRGDVTLQRKAGALFRFIASLEEEVATYVAS